ncbi:MAG TPA: ATP-dependent Clp protease ATP-binding subunit, partial [Woeseiaceae bacterium]|nr:ATP-dependent Clp protease ATP-binding subunit [Woeseiaceae bacterium]
KTAVVELLAQRLAAGKDRGALGARRIVEISMSSLLAGAKLLGDREERLESLVAECRGNDDVLLFIDELHTLVTAGGQPGAIDPKDILKPALARGEIRCIGATTIAEYVKHIDTDAALERRFDKIVVAEPTMEEAMEIVAGVAPHLSGHHGVEFDARALEAAVELSARFDTEHQLPDKAIDLLDKAAAHMRIPALSVAALANGPATRAPRVAVDAVVEALAHKLGVPLEVLAAHFSPGQSGKRTEMLEARLNERILGQSAASRAIAERMRLADAGLSDRDGPRAVMLFLGSTGIGKTEMARALAEQLFGDERHLIRLDMSEFMEEHDVLKLIGAPPGYIGHDEPGQLTGQLRAKPHAVVLLDEIDKAHPRALDLLLQVFDAGRITDSKGRTNDLRHAVFVMTSNVPIEHGGHRIGFLPTTSKDGPMLPELQALKQHFRPEFLNRIDATIVFEPLSPEVVRTLTSKHIDRIRTNLGERFGKSLHVDDAVIEYLCTTGFSSDYGARELRRTVEHMFEAPLSELVLASDNTDWAGIAVELDGDRLCFNKGDDNE